MFADDADPDDGNAADVQRAEAKALLRATWIGEIGKFLLTVLLFAVIFASVRPISALAVFGGFVAAQIVTIGVLALSGWAEDEQAVAKVVRHGRTF